MAMIRISSQIANCKITDINDNIKEEIDKRFKYIEDIDDICLGITSRLYDCKKFYLLLYGEPSKDEWYEKGLAISIIELANKDVKDFMICHTTDNELYPSSDIL